MKKLIYILSVSALICASCSTDFKFDDNGLSFIELPPYVAFTAPGANVTVDPLEVNEGSGTVPEVDTTPDDLNIEVPGGTLSDVTVNYALSGTAVFGVDYTIDGATGSGGSLVIQHKQSPDPLDNLIDNADLYIDILTDGITDGEKTIIVTLVSASNAEGDLSVGRGGTDFLKSTTVIISDVD